MVRPVCRPLLAALFVACGSASYAQRPLVFATPEPTLAPMGSLPAPPAPSPMLGTVPTQALPTQTIPMPIPQIDSDAIAAPPAQAQAACCGAASAVASCGCSQPAAPACGLPAPVAPCCASAAPATACGCAVGGAASFAAFGGSAQMFPGGPNGGGYSGSMGVLAAPGYGPIGGNFGNGPLYPGYAAGIGDGSGNLFYAGGYATAGFGSAVSGAWPTYYGQTTGAQAYSGFPMGYAAGGTAGEHVRNPYYNDRRPWYTPGPGSRTVSIVW